MHSYNNYFVGSRHGLTNMNSYVKTNLGSRRENQLWTACLYFKLLYVKLTTLVIKFMQHLFIMTVEKNHSWF